MDIRNITKEKFYYNKLYYDYIFNFEKLKDFYTYDYRLNDSYINRISYIKNSYDHKFREIISNSLLEYNKSINCSNKTIENIKLLKNEDTLVVIAGQQPAIFTGAIFSIYKIITVLNLADYLKKSLNLNIIPLFWNASDDNDLPEVKSIKISESQFEKISLDVPEYLSGFSYSKIILPIDEIENVSRKMIYSLPETDFKKEINKFIEEIIINLRTDKRKSGISISKFYSLIIAKMFKNYGLVIFDPEIQEIKKLFIKLINFDLDNFNKINSLVEFNGNELISEGYHAQLKLIKNNLDFFLNTENGREKIKSKSEDKNIFIFEKSVKTEKNELDKNKLRDIIFKNITDVGLNVVLRPLFQDFILPNIATVCGPGEISYYAQLKDVYTLFGSELPVLYPRMSATLIENKVRKAFLKLNLSYDEIEDNQDNLANKIFQNIAGFNYQIYLENMEKELYAVLQKYVEEIKNHGFDASEAFGRINQNLKKEVEVLGKKIINEYKRKNSFIVETISKIYNNILPDGKLQERVINIFEYINKYGFDLIDNIYLTFKIFDFSHKFIEIN
ncbi:MAG: bacillithiol biosynthesis cysteine-adding enzyme BshC [Actinobacteria bacterium]|nr:bacillithiol biosynthesis cysteine-adding enzyme BshC [Actinomycetota bacterium]